jgi:hypothetical protein
MLTAKPTEGRKKWPRGQKFTLSAAGLEAEEAYRTVVLGARSSGRTALEAALTSWAGPRRLAGGDGVILAELSGKRLGLSHLCEALETSGIVPEEVRAAVGRLVDAGIVEPVPLASQQPQPQPAQRNDAYPFTTRR